MYSCTYAHKWRMVVSAAVSLAAVLAPTGAAAQDSRHDALVRAAVERFESERTTLTPRLSGAIRDRKSTRLNSSHQ